MMATLLTKPDNWQISMKNLISETPSGRDKTRRIIKELIEFGYIIRRKERIDDGTFHWVATVYEHPKKETMAGKPVDGETVDGKPVDIINTDLPNTITNDSNESLVVALDSSPDPQEPEKSVTHGKNALTKELVESFCKEFNWPIQPGKKDNLVNGWVNPLLKVYAQFGKAFGLFDVKDNGMPGEYIIDDYTVYCTILTYLRARAKHVNEDGTQLSMKSPDSLTYLINDMLPGFIEAAVQKREAERVA